MSPVDARSPADARCPADSRRPADPPDLLAGLLRAYAVANLAVHRANAFMERLVNRCSRPKWEFKEGFRPYCQRSFDAGHFEYEVMIFRKRTSCLDRQLNCFAGDRVSPHRRFN